MKRSILDTKFVIILIKLLTGLKFLLKLCKYRYKPVIMAIKVSRHKNLYFCCVFTDTPCYGLRIVGLPIHFIRHCVRMLN